MELCRDVLGLRLNEGAIANALGRVATRAGPVVERIWEQVRASPVINSDETGARVDGDNRCHWVFQTPTASYHRIAATKGAAVIAESLGDQQPAVWGSDAAPAQLGAAALFAASPLGLLGGALDGPREVAEPDDADLHSFDRAVVRGLNVLTGPRDFMPTDHAYLALLANRMVPPKLADLSFGRIRAGVLTDQDLLTRTCSTRLNSLTHVWC